MWSITGFFMTCLPPKIAMITLLNSHTSPSLTFWHLEHYTFSVLRNDPKFGESRGLSIAQNPNYRIWNTTIPKGSRELRFLITLNLLLKPNVTDFLGTLKSTAYHSFGKMLQVAAVIICQLQGTCASKTFFVFQTNKKIIQPILFLGTRREKR